MSRAQTKTPSVITSLEIEGQGSIPYAVEQPCPIPAAPKKGFTSSGQRAGEMTARGFGLQMRATKFVLR
jgi:hypothetical protein